MRLRIVQRYLLSFISLFFSLNTFALPLKSFFEPGKVWLDTDGKPIEAHGGGILKHGKTYFWYGENHALGEGNKSGISCYSVCSLRFGRRAICCFEAK